MFLSRYTISKSPDILEIDPSNGVILRRFRTPTGWQWDPERDSANWEEYRGRVFLVYRYEKDLVFQQGKARFVLDGNYKVSQQAVRLGWCHFRLFCKGEEVYSFIYRRPQTRLRSLLLAFTCDEDWFDWDTPFDDVEKWCNGDT